MPLDGAILVTVTLQPGRSSSFPTGEALVTEPDYAYHAMRRCAKKSMRRSPMLLHSLLHLHESGTRSLGHAPLANIIGHLQ